MLLCWLIVLSYASFLWCNTTDKVSLSWRRDGDHLCFACDVKNLSLGVSFKDPNGNTRGHCTAPIPHTVAGHCDSHLKQNIFNETTILTVDMVGCENGLWKCFHGENTNEYATASVSVLVDSMEQKPKGKYYSNYFDRRKIHQNDIKKNWKHYDSWKIGSQVHKTVSFYDRYKCTLLPFVCGYVVALLLLIIGRLLFSKTQNETGQQCFNVCKTNLSTKHGCMIVGLHFVIILTLPLLFMLIPGICEGSWWILVTIVVAILTGVLQAALGVIPDRMYNLVQRR